MRKLILLVVLFLAPFSTASGHSILAVFSHPDDETAVGPLPAKYAAEGHDVYLVTVTSGQAGNANTDIPKGTELGAEREKEARCSCEALGIHEPFLLQFMDGDVGHPRTMWEMMQRLQGIINKVKPDVIITWGPDGVTGHPDHRTVSNVTTQIFQQRSVLEHHPRKLYYVAWPESRYKNPPPAFKGPRFRGLVSDVFITTEVDVGKYLDRGYKSIQCHKTQWNEERMRQHRYMQAEIAEGKTFLRLVLADLPSPEKKETDILAGLD